MTTTTRPNYAPGILPLTRATATPTTVPPVGTAARYVGSIADLYCAPVLVDGPCACLRCFPIEHDGPRLVLSLPDGTQLRHARLTSIRVAP